MSAHQHQPTFFLFCFCLGSVLTANKLEFSSSSLVGSWDEKFQVSQTKTIRTPGMSQRRRRPFFLLFLSQKRRSYSAIFYDYPKRISDTNNSNQLEEPVHLSHVWNIFFNERHPSSQVPCAMTSQTINELREQNLVSCRNDVIHFNIMIHLMLICTWDAHI
jgi:hypothetical protein